MHERDFYSAFFDLHITSGNKPLCKSQDLLDEHAYDSMTDVSIT